MKLYRDNRRSGEWELTEEEIARRYLASDYATWWHWPLERKLSLFLESSNGLSSTWTDRDAYNRVIEHICRLRREGGDRS